MELARWTIMKRCLTSPKSGSTPIETSDADRQNTARELTKIVCNEGPQNTRLQAEWDPTLRLAIHRLMFEVTYTFQLG